MVLNVGNLLEENFIHLPPKPSSLLSDSQFLKHYRKHYQKPPLLRFFTGITGTKHINFVPLFYTKPDRIPVERFAVPNSTNPLQRWRFLGCRHGLVILLNQCQREAVMWDPFTGQKNSVPFPP
ncbi:uncharacterized protein [Lolium perenne]|uniref:uncharacterized protein n=1 Tax=Lolium perenne TaxID=4522 RepID=UPI003A9A42CE